MVFTAVCGVRRCCDAWCLPATATSFSRKQYWQCAQTLVPCQGYSSQGRGQASRRAASAITMQRSRSIRPQHQQQQRQQQQQGQIRLYSRAWTTASCRASTTRPSWLASPLQVRCPRFCKLEFVLDTLERLCLSEGVMNPLESMLGTSAVKVQGSCFNAAGLPLAGSALEARTQGGARGAVLVVGLGGGGLPAFLATRCCLLASNWCHILLCRDAFDSCTWPLNMQKFCRCGLAAGTC